MTEHRRRRQRPRVAISALAGMKSWERPRDVLNKLTPDVDRCAWPGCRRPTRLMLQGHVIEDRYGVLCHVHGVDVAVAVVRDQQRTHSFQEIIAQQDADRIARAADAKRIDKQIEAEKAALRQDRDGFVYYIRIGERIKVGYSVDVRRRMRAYPPESALLAIEPGDRDLETERHRQFSASRTHGREWYTLTPDLQEHIDSVIAEHGEPPRHMAHHYRAKRQPMRLSRRP